MAKKISDLVAELNTELDGAVARIQTDVSNYEQRIADLQAKIDAGEATPADEAAMEELKAKLAAIDPTNPDVLPGS